MWSERCSHCSTQRPTYASIRRPPDERAGEDDARCCAHGAYLPRVGRYSLPSTAMTLTQLEHVIQAHKAGSFSRGARACGVTQAALSNSVAKLEEELGERIFSRTTRH